MLRFAYFLVCQLQQTCRVSLCCFLQKWSAERRQGRGLKCLFVTLHLQGRETCVKFLYLGINCFFFFNDLSLGEQGSFCVVVHLSCECCLVNFEQMKRCRVWGFVFCFCFSPLWLCVPYRVWKVSGIIYIFFHESEKIMIMSFFSGPRFFCTMLMEYGSSGEFEKSLLILGQISILWWKKIIVLLS